MPCSTQSIQRGRRPWITTGLRVLWALIRLPAVTVLLTLEPLVSLVLVGIFVLGTGAAVILRLSGDLPDLPFWGMVTFALSSILALAAYHALAGILSK